MPDKNGMASLLFKVSLSPSVLSTRIIDQRTVFKDESMRTFFPVMIIVFLLLVGCATNDGRSTPSNFINQETVIKTTKEIYPIKKPQNVAFYTNDLPHKPYRVIGVAKVAKYNLLGVERHDETVQTMMKELAASVGGDGLIDFNQTKDGASANIIAFQKILI